MNITKKLTELGAVLDEVIEFAGFNVQAAFRFPKKSIITKSSDETYRIANALQKQAKSGKLKGKPVTVHDLAGSKSYYPEAHRVFNDPADKLLPGVKKARDSFAKTQRARRAGIDKNRDLYGADYPRWKVKNQLSSISPLTELSELDAKLTEVLMGDRAYKMLFPSGVPPKTRAIGEAVKGNLAMAKQAMGGSAWADQSVKEIRSRAAKAIKAHRAGWPKKFRGGTTPWSDLA